MRGPTRARGTRVRAARAAAVAISLVLVTAGCGGGSGEAAPTGDGRSSSATAAVDDGTTLTMWTRAGTEALSRAYVDAYNATHRNQVRLTGYPNEEYPAKLASAAGARALPDLFAADVVFAPQYAAEGLWQDLTDRLATTGLADRLAPGHVRAGTWEGRGYAVPHVIDLSVMFYDRKLFTRAGLDPDKPPVSLGEFAEAARAVGRLGGGVHGTYFGGNCGGCVEFTFWPSVWASGGTVLAPDGRSSTIASRQMADVFSLYRALYQEGVAAPASKDEAGPTWLAALKGGKVGIAPGPSAWLDLIEKAGVDVGVAAIPGLDGGESTFVGGDAVGIGATSAHAAQAWDFVAWTLSDAAQVEVVAKGKGVPVRTDLAVNAYSSADPRLVTINTIAAKGQTPYARNFNASFNDPQSPWLRAVRGALFGDAPAALAEGDAAITASLRQQ